MSLDANPAVVPVLPRLPAAERIDWRPVLDPRGRWTALVTPGSSPDRAARHCAGLGYVSVPYHFEAQIRGVWRVERSLRMSIQASREMTLLAACGVSAICPNLTWADMANDGVLVEEGPDPLDLRFWSDWSQPMLNAAALIVVPAIPGWDRCPMVWRDLRHGLQRNLPVHVYGGRDG